MAFINGTTTGGIVKLFTGCIDYINNPYFGNLDFDGAFDYFMTKGLPEAFDRNKLKQFPAEGSDSLRELTRKEVNAMIARRNAPVKKTKKRASR